MVIAIGSQKRDPDRFPGKDNFKSTVIMFMFRSNEGHKVLFCLLGVLHLSENGMLLLPQC